MRGIVRAILIAAAAISAGATMQAQALSAPSIRIQVVDSGGRGIPGVEVSLINGMSNVRARGITDSLGGHTLTVQAAGEYQVAARRLGYQPLSVFALLHDGTQALRMTLSATPVRLGGETVTAERDQPQYHIGADEIANSDRVLFNALDVLTKLKPEMIDARTPTVFDPCWLQDVWVNGERITFAPVDERLLLDKRQTLEAIVLRRPVSAGKSHTPGVVTGLASVPLNVQSVLASIHPEHVLEMRRSDCNDVTPGRPHMRNAVFVALKPGVKFEAGRGSYVSEAALAIAPNRNRIVGVFSERSGAPIPDASVTDERSGESIATSETGTGTLAFLSDGEHVLRIHKQGYQDEVVRVTLSAAELMPLTVVLKIASR